jgi:hypothetical protein
MVDLPYIEPELWENRGEGRPLKNNFRPNPEDIKGDPTTPRPPWAQHHGGNGPAAKDGVIYLAITNHSKRVSMAHV